MTIGSDLYSFLQSFLPSGETPSAAAAFRQFVPTKQLCETDLVVVDMLNSPGHEHTCYCVCDPDLDDLPIIFASDGFCRFTGFCRNEIEGRNCRFLQGPKTSPDDVDKIRKALKDQTPTSVNLLNYRKDGTTFVNEFFLSPLRDENKKLLYFIGVQCQVPKLGPGQMPANAGWIYMQGNHV